MRAMLLLLAMAMIDASPAFAGFEYQGFDKTIEPGNVLEQELGCSGGRLLSGGYILDDTDGPHARLLVLADGPVPDDRWRIALMNDHDAPVRVKFRLSVLCD